MKMMGVFGESRWYILSLVVVQYRQRKKNYNGQRQETGGRPNRLESESYTGVFLSEKVNFNTANDKRKVVKTK